MLNTADLTTVGALVAAIVALSKVIEVLVARAWTKKNGDPQARLEAALVEVGRVQTEFGSAMIKVSETLKRIDHGVAQLVRQHDAKDEDGVPIWYVRRSLEKAIVDLGKTVAATENTLRALAVAMQTMAGDISMIKEEIREVLIRLREENTGRTHTDDVRGRR